MFTIIDRIKALGLVATKRERWAIGAAVRQRWFDMFGTLPDKQLRGKTAGNGGSHCLAVYPDFFASEADPIIRRICSQSSPQGLLF